MGEHHVIPADDPAAIRRFSQALLDDLRALERMCAEGRIEHGVHRIGVEQEMFLVDRQGRPAPVAEAVLAALDDTAFTSEIGRFNLEYNQPARVLGPGALQALEDDLTEAISRVRHVAATLDADVCLCGILPSIDQADLTPANLTPEPRYLALNAMITRLAGGRLRTLIQGRDNLQVELDSVMLEACTTSLQVHLQLDEEELARAYNIAQMVAAPILAMAGNSPLLLQHRLWEETRIPAFEQGLDIRSPGHRRRDTWRRVDFGDDWVGNSVLEIYRDQVARHRPMVLCEPGESSLAMLDRGDVPPLGALTVHNGSLYRWNRPCYGVVDGIPHLRLEHRPLPAGPTVLDEVANIAFFTGLVHGMLASGEDPRRRFRHGDARANFVRAARYGMDVALHWTDGTTVPVRTLVLQELLPVANRGLVGLGLTDAEIDRYLRVIGERAASGRTGARWLRAAHEALGSIRNPQARTQALTRLLMARQHRGEPVHTWSPPGPEEVGVTSPTVARVADIMVTDLFTVHAEDLIDVAAAVMRWKHIRHVPVEDNAGRLVGLLARRDLIAHAAQAGAASTVPVRQLMLESVCTIGPHASCAEAIDLLRRADIGCLPVVDQDRLVGIVSERDFLRFAAAWFDLQE